MHPWSFVWKEAQSNVQAYGEADVNEQTLLGDASEYRDKFNAALQYFYVRSQHHLHKKNASGKRVIPDGCKSKSHPNQCRHEAPWENRVHRGKSIVLCKQFAKRCGLRCSGRRNVLGGILGTRNNEWLNGTCPALCVGLGGCNTDTQNNDKIPILPETHEDDLCNGRCVKKRGHAKLTRILQTAQSTTNGYFGGYIGKRQATAKLETKKCIDKMYVLRRGVEGKSEKDQQRAVTGRMVTDIEMNGAVRGAVELFNLCRNLRKSDALFAECVRTFCTISVDAQTWLRRLEVELQHVDVLETLAVVPPTSRPNVRSVHAKPPVVDAYGFRPLDAVLGNLCPYQFLMCWDVLPVLPPHRQQHSKAPVCSRYINDGEKVANSEKYKEGKMNLTPGVHYEVVPSEDGSYITFQHLLEDSSKDKYVRFANSWILQRRQRPYVVVLTGMRLPSVSSSREENAKYCSVFFRPWTLLDGHRHVAHLQVLGLTATSCENVGGCGSPGKKRMRRKTVTLSGESKEAAMSFTTTWDEYIQGNIVSQHAARLIQSFLLNTIAKGAESDSEEDHADASDEDEDVAPFHLGAADLRAILRRRLTGGDVDSESDQEGLASSANRIKSKKRRLSGAPQHQRAVKRSRALWETAPQTRPADVLSSEGPMCHNQVKDHIKKRNERGDDKEELRPYAGKTQPQAWLYGGAEELNLDAWLQRLSAREVAPNCEQLKFLSALVERVKQEIREERANIKQQSEREPMLDLVHGLPGTGKSQMIVWIRELFEEVLGWEHGVHFVCLAFQNAMAAHIEGETIHHWSGIPAREADGTASTTNAHKLSMKCQCLRFILIDEISMVSAELLGALEKVVARAVRKRGGYKLRVDGSMRLFGGINLIFFGDWWQLRPVGATAIFNNPLQVESGIAYHGQQIFWGTEADSIRHTWELYEPVRCQDQWSVRGFPHGIIT